MKYIIVLLLLLLSIASLLAARKLPPLKTVDKVDLNRYKGLWYQFAYFPNSFQPRNAGLVTAEYGILPNGYVTVKNTSYDDFEGTRVRKSVSGKVFIADSKTNSKLKVQLFWPFRGDYWIILLDEKNYTWAVVSDPSRKYLWVLTRTPYLEKGFYDSLVSRIAALGLDTDKIVVTGRFKP